MVTSVISKPFDIFIHAVDKINQVEDKITTFAKKSFSSIKEIQHVPSKVFNYVKENKFSTSLSALSIAISAIVFVYVSAFASIIFLGAVSFVKAYAYTHSYVKSADYQFKKLAKDYIHILEKLCRNYKNGKQLTNDLVIGKIKTKLFDCQEAIINFIYNNAKNYDQFISWQKHLENLNPNLRLSSSSFPRFDFYKTINDNVFKNNHSNAITQYIFYVFDFVYNKEEIDYKAELKNLVKNCDPQSSTLKTDILSQLENVESFLKDSTKRDIALQLYKEIKTSRAIQRTFASNVLSAVSTPFELVKGLFSTTHV